MAEVLSLPQIRRFSGRVAFTRKELGDLLSLYGERVSRGEWRDYAVDCMQGMAVFSIFRHSHENPLFSVAKIEHYHHRKPPVYMVVAGNRTLAHEKSLLDALAVFDTEDTEKLARSRKPGPRRK